MVSATRCPAEISGRVPMSELDLPAQRAGSTPNGVRLGIIGTGWVGLRRARIAAADGRVAELHLAFVKEQFDSGALGRPTTILISRHLTRELGAKIAGRGPLGPVQMEATHDIDLALWWLHPRRPARIYAQSADGIMLDRYAQPDCAWIMITMEDGTVVTIGADW